MSIDALSDFLPSKEECLKESEVGHKTLGISIEVDKDKIEKNHDNKSEEKSYHDILKNNEVLAFIMKLVFKYNKFVFLKMFSLKVLDINLVFQFCYFFNKSINGVIEFN